jgi:hypothetical protein
LASSRTGWRDDPASLEPPRNPTCYYTIAVGQPAQATLTPLPPPAVETLHAVEIEFPHYQSFALSVGNSFAGQMGWVFGRENDNQLVVAAMQTSAVAVLYDWETQTLLDVPGVGGVRDTGDPAKNRQLAINSSSQAAEYSLWYGDTYSQGEVEPVPAPTMPTSKSAASPTPVKAPATPTSLPAATPTPVTAPATLLPTPAATPTAVTAPATPTPPPAAPPTAVPPP